MRRSSCLDGCVLTLALVFSTASIAAEHPLARAPWWPYSTGPFYGEVPAAHRLDPRVIRLPAGSFDTRGPGLDLPDALRLTPAAAARPGTPWLVQLPGPVRDADKDALRAAGARIYAYLPSNTFVVRAAEPGKLHALAGVLWAGPYHPGYRIEPWLGTAPTADPAVASNTTLRVRAVLFDPAERGPAIASLETLGAVIDRAATFSESEPGDHVYFAAPPTTVVEAARLDAVRWIEEVSRGGFALNAESKVVLQSGSVGGGTPYWDAGVDGSTQVVGDMDSGLDVDVIAMSDTASDAGTPGPAHRKVLAYTPYGGGDTATCAGVTGYSHGTNTSQCAAGNRDDLGLGDNLDGVAHRAKVVFQDIGPSNTIACLLGSLSPPSSLLAMYDEVRSLGGHLSNGSFSLCSGYGSHASDADRYMWEHRDFLMFFSAGNGGSGLVCPGTGKNVIAAGGHYQDPFQDEFYGSTGPAPDGRMGPTVLGPACDHAGGNPPPFDYDTSTSFQSTDGDITGTPSTTLNQGACGTSFSSPYLMGAAALARDYFEKGYYPSGAASPADAFGPSGALIKAVLLNSGEFVTCTECGTSFMDSMGMGRVNLSRTLAVAGDARTPRGTRIVDDGVSDGLATGGVFEDTIDVLDAAAPFRVTLNWTDREGSALVNDLRLTVIGPAGDATQTYHGGNFSGRYTLSEAAGGTADDHVNPFEAVHVPPEGAVAGTWTIRVEGTNVPMGDPAFGDTQPFALVASGGFDSVAKPPEVSASGASTPLVASGVDATSVTWSWEDLGDPSVTYQLYRGDLGSLRATGSYDHGAIDAGQCALVAATSTVGDRNDGLDSYYLVGARKDGVDGALGAASDGTARPPADPACP